jgi:hypothetical protein
MRTLDEAGNSLGFGDGVRAPGAEIGTASRFFFTHHLTSGPDKN